jgi:predicted amidohydrolase YtcJ
MVIPGLVDAHVHLANLCASLTRVDLVGVSTEEDAVRRVTERAASTPAGEWIVGYGWDEGAWANRYPDMRLLSERVPNHPVWLAGLHSFAGWGNRMAFERAGITAASAAPEGGEIRRDAAGSPTGILLNNAVQLVESAIPAPGAPEMDARMLAALHAMARAGYTAVHDANTDAAMLASLQRLAASDSLPIRVSVMLAARDTALVREWLVRGPDTSRSAMLRVTGVKFFYDGALGSRGALLLADYSDMPGHRGRGGADIGFDEALAVLAMERGFQVVIHAIGDAANRRALDVFERAFQRNPALRAGRHRIEHAQILAPEDIPRFAQIGVIASMQPGHAVEDMAWAEARVGARRIRGGYAWRSLRMSGAQLLFSSDMPGSSFDFFYMLHAAVTRQNPENLPPGGWYPAERLNAEEALRAYTSWAAHALFTENETGMIAPGRWADLTVLGGDIFSAAARDPARQATSTIVRGRTIWTTNLRR